MVVGHGQSRNFRIVVYLNVLSIGLGSLSGVSDESWERGLLLVELMLFRFEIVSL